MRLDTLELTDFRNIAQAKLHFESPRQFFLGPNGQGKTNILEAIALADMLRSFRGVTRAAMIHTDSPQATVRGVWHHEQRGQTALGIAMTPTARKTQLDGQAIKSLEEIIGVFPVVVLTLADRALIYSGPSVRRAEIDKLLSQLDPSYYDAIKAYTKALKSRNALLQIGSVAQIIAFEREMARAGIEILHKRQQMWPHLQAEFQHQWSLFAPPSEQAQITYEPNIAQAEDMPELLRQNRARELAAGITLIGPHRDKIELVLNGHPAQEYASEGQKFSLVLALKLAGLALIQRQLGVWPVLVADDLLLELDPVRQAKFWQAVAPLQVFASGTVWPSLVDKTGWQIWNVKNGTFTLEV